MQNEINELKTSADDLTMTRVFKSDILRIRSLREVLRKKNPRSKHTTYSIIADGIDLLEKRVGK